MFRVMSCLAGEHDLRLVVLAGCVCFLASFVAINLFGRANAAKARARVAWIALAGVATGCGIWATHFIAMLAYEPGVPIAYDVTLTLLSFAVASGLMSAGIALTISGANMRSALLGGGVVGLAIALMHFIGMQALQVPGQITW